MLLGAVVATILILDNTTQVKFFEINFLVHNSMESMLSDCIGHFLLDVFQSHHDLGKSSLVFYSRQLLQLYHRWTIRWSSCQSHYGINFLADYSSDCHDSHGSCLAWRFNSFDCHPSLADKIRVKQRQTKQSRCKPEMLRTPSARRSRRSLRSSYAFAHEVNFRNTS